MRNNEIASVQSFYSLQSIKKQIQSWTPQPRPSLGILAIQDSSSTEVTGTLVSVDPAPAQVFVNTRLMLRPQLLPPPASSHINWKFLQNPVTYRNSIDQTSKMECLNTSAYTPKKCFWSKCWAAGMGGKGSALQGCSVRELFPAQSKDRAWLWVWPLTSPKDAVCCFQQWPQNSASCFV